MSNMGQAIALSGPPPPAEQSRRQKAIVCSTALPAFAGQKFRAIRLGGNLGAQQLI
jgi:hypothetical protein